MAKPHHAATDAIQELKDGWVFTPRALNIVWGNDDRYWIITDGQGQKEAAKLVQVSWLEVTGSTKKPLTTGKKYGVSFTIELSEGAFGWNGCPVFVMAKVGKKGKNNWSKVQLSDLQRNQMHEIPQTQIIVEVPENPSDEPVLHFGLYEVWSGKWKGGLNIYHAKVQEIP